MSIIWIHEQRSKMNVVILARVFEQDYLSGEHWKILQVINS